MKSGFVGLIGRPNFGKSNILFDFSLIIPISAFKKDNIEHLIDVLEKYLPDSIPYFDTNTVTSSSNEFLISELVREKVLELTNDEVPHSVTCITEEISEDKSSIRVIASLIVDRENLKKILIG